MGKVCLLDFPFFDLTWSNKIVPFLLDLSDCIETLSVQLATLVIYFVWSTKSA